MEHLTQSASPKEFRKTSEKCLRKNSAASRYEKRKAHGLCAYGNCPAAPAPGHMHCREHLRRMLQAQTVRCTVRKKNRLCIVCGVRVQFWGVRCIICRERSIKDPRALPHGARRALRLYREAERKMQIERRETEARFAVRKLLASGDINGDCGIALRLYAGLDNGRWRTGAEVAKLMHVSKERVRQLLYPPKVILTETLGASAPWKPLRIKAPRTSAEKSWKQPIWLRRR